MLLRHKNSFVTLAVSAQHTSILENMHLVIRALVSCTCSPSCTVVEGCHPFTDTSTRSTGRQPQPPTRFTIARTGALCSKAPIGPAMERAAAAAVIRPRAGDMSH
ncbi:hypothetical protein IG631_16272 [Alternaria alternata]|jgi:hypothetical protein|nr:hypothetical protein IG631_16272 [Alternaria alternata]